METELSFGLFLAWILIPVPIAIWATAAWPKREITKKYSFLILSAVNGPIGKRWVDKIDESDRNAFQAARSRYRVVWIYFLVSTPVWFILTQILNRMALLNYR